jgi:hypothetical protein
VLCARFQSEKGTGRCRQVSGSSPDALRPDVRSAGRRIAVAAGLAGQLLHRGGALIDVRPGAMTERKFIDFLELLLAALGFSYY